MRHAYGKPQGTTARVAIGQVCAVFNVELLCHHVVDVDAGLLPFSF